jgi:hypothetical protein
MLVCCYKMVSSLAVATLATMLLLWSMSDASVAQSAGSAQLTGDGKSIELGALSSVSYASLDADPLFSSSTCCSGWHCSTPPLAITSSCKLPPAFRQVLLPPMEWMITLAADAALILDPPR